MGWQRRSSGRLYDSFSGHVYLIGCRTGKVIMRRVMYRKCSVCTLYHKKDLPKPKHICNINHEESSGSMKVILCWILLEEVNTLFICRITVAEVVSNDDSTLRSYCSSLDNGGKLCEGVREPKFLADPTHRTKMMVKPVFALVKRTKKQEGVNQSMLYA